MKKQVRALALLARIIGRKHGLTVEFDPRAVTASTDGKKIVLPVVANVGTDQHAVLIEGLVDHEAMHCRYTDFDAIAASVREGVLVRQLTNIFEDVRGEACQAVSYPGCAINIRQALKVMTKIGLFAGLDPSKGCSPLAALCNYLLLKLRARANALEEFDQFASTYRPEIEAALGPVLLEKILDVAQECSKSQSTWSVLDLAKRIVSMLQAALDETSGPPEAPGSPEQQGASLDGNVVGSGDTNGGPCGDGVPGTASQSDEPHAKPAQPGQSGQGGTGPSRKGKRDKLEEMLEKGQQADPGMSGDLADKLMEALAGQRAAGAQLEQGESSHARSRAAGAGTRGGPFTAGKPRFKHEMDAMEQAKQYEAMGLSHGIEVQLGTKLESLLEALDDTLVMFKRSGRRLEARRLTNVRLGRLDVFKSFEEQEELNTSVQFLIDASGSMSEDFGGSRHSPLANRRIVAAAAITHAAAQVLERRDVPFAISAFGDKLIPVKGFDESWRSSRVDRSFVPDLGGTQTDQAVFHALEALLARDERRRLAVLATDGEPADVPATVAVMEEGRRLGVEFALLFIGTQGARLEGELSTRGYRCARAKSSPELAHGLFEAIEGAF